MSERVDYSDLLAFSEALFQAEGLSLEMAAVLARGFVDAELLGFRSHGVVKIASNLAWLREGATRRAGEPVVLTEWPAIASWDAQGLPGHWAMHRALNHAMSRAREQGAFTMTIHSCQHVACLASTLMPAVVERMVVLLMVSSPDEAFVSPFGGSARLFSNNPIAFTAPGRIQDATANANASPSAGGAGADADPVNPILFDVSMAITAGSQVARAARLGLRLPEASIKTASGGLSDDPAELSRQGSVMPIGGPGHGHKGHALTIMTEVLTQALAGHGRSGNRPESELNNVYLQVMDPRAFAAVVDYDREMAHLLNRVQHSPPDTPGQPVRLPGERAWALRAEQMHSGVRLDPGVLDLLRPYALASGISVPKLTGGEDD